MGLIDNIKNYFSKKENNQDTDSSPEGICPNCWGKQEWDSEYYKFMKGENGNPSTETYTTFIKDVARKLDKIQVHKNSYTCETCNINYENN